MDYSAVVDSIPAERLELVEILTENRLQLLDMLHSLHPLMILQDVLPVIAQYCKLKDYISYMLKDMENLTGRKKKTQESTSFRTRLTIRYHKGRHARWD